MNPQTQPDQGNETDEGAVVARPPSDLDRARSYLERAGRAIDAGNSGQAGQLATLGMGFALLAQAEAAGPGLRFDGDLDPELVSEAVRQLRRAAGEGASRV